MKKYKVQFSYNNNTRTMGIINTTTVETHDAYDARNQIRMKYSRVRYGIMILSAVESK